MADQRLLRRLMWWTIAASAAVFAISIVSISLISYSLTKPSHHPTTQPTPWVPLTLLSNAHPRGPLCLDGSLPGYHFQKGFGSGSHNWVLHIEGGGWCDSIESCSSRMRTALGSSKYMGSQVEFAGILSPESSQNPDFFNWNKVKIRYCDGGSFAGHPESEFKALLSGCSAGGLATLIHCDDFHEILPKTATVKCLADAGFFLNEKDIGGNRTIESFYQDVVNLQGIAKSLDKDCIARMEPGQQAKCFFPQEFIENIKTSIFLVHPAYDFWQIKNIFIPDSSDPRGSWLSCKLNINNCSPSQIEVLEGYRNSLLKLLSDFQQNKDVGVFIDSCFVHCQTWVSVTWHSRNSPRINNRTIAESVGDWYFNRKVAKHIDCPYPCNPTCYNMDFTVRG
ncbi:pectin acetylesterase 5-like isoform X2 [Rhododendron vialii]|uniref:pectin acetylesterase 5-like isoform X2 n=1 Tax=Rhododendron vialii TaxID=182163 RepID=UPI00265E9B9B|nr:pectin acetylesterase 5-like isoform X2 [Rhododendron vialii]